MEASVPIDDFSARDGQDTVSMAVHEWNVPYTDRFTTSPCFKI